jgi:hypothetical protein
VPYRGGIDWNGLLRQLGGVQRFGLKRLVLPKGREYVQVLEGACHEGMTTECVHVCVCRDSVCH